MSPLAVVITAEQVERLEELCESSGLSPDAQIGALIDLDWEEWQDALPPGPSRSTRFARFEAAETAEREAFIANATDEEDEMTRHLAAAEPHIRIARHEAHARNAMAALGPRSPARSEPSPLATALSASQAGNGAASAGTGPGPPKHE